MELSTSFIINSILFGIALAMDSFSVTVGNTLKHPEMTKKQMYVTSLTFGLFQGLMPFLGWLGVKTAVELFSSLSRAIPYISLGLLLFLGIRMIIEGKELKDDPEKEIAPYSFSELIIQAVATSIDALSVGFAVSSYSVSEVLISVSIIAVVTFFICIAAVHLGKALARILRNRSLYVGGAILIFIGIEIFVSNVFF